FLKSVLRISHSAQLVGIPDSLGDPPFGLLHPLSALAFNIFTSWIIGTLEQKVRIRPFGDSPNGFGDSQSFISLFIQLLLFLFAK
ncbi:hypothetical protein H5410_031665, partial [Solanum commersonii]